MDITNFLNPKMAQKISLLPPEALQYLLKQIDNMPDEQPEKQKMLRIADIARKTLEEHKNAGKKKEKRQLNLKRYFYLPFNKILFDGEFDRRQSGRISRNSMEKIWTYIETKLLPDEVKELELAFRGAVEAKEMKKAKIIVNEFNRLAGQKLEEVIVKCREKDREWARFAMVIGNKLIAKDAEELCYYLQNTAKIEAILKQFSVEITDLNGSILSKITNEINKNRDEDPKLFSLYISIFIASLKHQAHVLRVIQKYYRIDDASSAAKCDLSILGDLLLFNAKISVGQFKNDEKNHVTHETHLEHYLAYADIILGLEREFDVSPISSWGKVIIDLRAEVSESLEKDILACPQRLRNILGRYQKVVDGVPADHPAKIEIAELYSCVYLLHGIKNYISATSCNAIYRENYDKCIQFIDVFSVGIVEQIRRAQPSDKKTMLKYLDISTELIKIIKNPEQAELYHKSGLLAARGTD